MTPYSHHMTRQKAGMSVTAEILLDMVSHMQPVIGTSLKADAIEHGVASPATLQKEIHWLIDNGYLSFGKDKVDARKMPLSVTKRGRKHLSDIR